MADGNFARSLNNYIGQTVTIFTTSGGQSGSGFTGVLVAVNPAFVRLITQIGSAPGCALGNCCPGGGLGNVGGVNDTVCADGYEDNFDNFRNGGNVGNIGNIPGPGRANCGGRLGSVVDIPINRIASFVHNSVGSSW